MKKLFMTMMASATLAFSSLGAQAALTSVTGQSAGPVTATSLPVTVVSDSADFGAAKSLWVAAAVPNVGFFFRNSAGWVLWKAGAPVPNPMMSNVTANSITVDVLGGAFSLVGLAGTSVYVGFAQNANEMLTNGDYALAYTVPAANAPNNVTAMAVDVGPASLNTTQISGINNIAYVTVRICQPGTSNCATVDHVQVDTGSEGLRILKEALPTSFANALPAVTDNQSNPIGECLQYVGSYNWGSVRTADFTIGGEQVSSMPMQLVDGNFASVPSLCSGAGLQETDTVATFSANGIIGIGPAANDCGSTCVQGLTGASGYPYYSCPSTGCVQTALPLSKQVPNPVGMFAVDNNGTILQLPAAPVLGEQIMNGTLVFGIGTQSNNGLGNATVYTIDSSSDTFTTTYKGKALTQSYLDSGTPEYVLPDASIPTCSDATYFFCPTSTLSLSAVNTGLNGASGTVNFSIANADGLNFSFGVLPALAGPASNTSALSGKGSFAWGLPFFYGRNVYTALPGASTSGGVGPYFAY